MLYQLSYFRKNRPYQSYPLPHTVSRRRRACNSNRHSFLWEVMDSNHRRHSQQIYSLPHLATLVTSLVLLLSREEFASLVFPGGIGSFHSAAPRSTSPIPLWGGFRSTGARSLLPLQKFLRNLTSEKPCLRQASLCRQSFSSVPLTRFCNFISLPSRRLSEPMEGFEPPTS